MIDFNNLAADLIYASDNINTNSSFENLFFESLAEFRKEYGDVKFNKICDEVSNSKYVIITLGNFALQDYAPSEKSMLKVIGSSWFFIKTNKKNVAIGMAIFLFLWHQQCNKDNRVLDDNELVQKLERVFIKSKGLLF